MSKMNPDLAWYPPEFPEQGRLPAQAALVAQARQLLHYFNQMADWQSFRWPGETYKPGTMLTWTSTRAGARLFGDYSGTWGLIRWLEQSKRKSLDNSQWMMSFTAPDGRTLRSQLGKGPLALLELRGFTLPTQISTVNAAAAQALSANEGDMAMEGIE